MPAERICSKFLFAFGVAATALAGPAGAVNGKGGRRCRRDDPPFQKNPKFSIFFKRQAHRQQLKTVRLPQRLILLEHKMMTEAPNASVPSGELCQPDEFSRNFCSHLASQR